MTRRIVFAVTLFAAGTIARPAAAQERFVPDTALAATGKQIFSAKCVGCHTVGKGDLAAPDLSGLLDRRTTTWVKKWLKDPWGMVERDEIAKGLYKRYNLRMPNLSLSDQQIAALMHYIAQQTEQTRKENSATQ